MTLTAAPPPPPPPNGVQGREVTTGTSGPEEDPLDYMEDIDWMDTWENPEGREHLLPSTPEHMLQRMFGVDTYEELFSA